MPVQNIKEHMKCAFYATEETALFRQYHLADGTEIPSVNTGRSVLLYLAEGELLVTLGNYPRRTVAAGSLVFVPKNVGFYGHAADDCRIITCEFSGELPLCNKYDLVKLQSDVQRRIGRNLPPPIYSRNYLQMR